MYYAISPPEKSSWHLEMEDFAEKLRTKWPQMQIERTISAKNIYCLEFSLKKMDVLTLKGFFRQDGDLIKIESSLENAAHLATWIREHYPPISNWAFWTDSGDFAFWISNRSTEDIILAANNRLHEFT